MKKLLLLSLAILGIGIVFGFVWKQQRAKQKHQTKIDGKYKKNWEKIDSLLRIGQPKTALIEIESLLKTTEKNEEHAEWLRALMFKFQTTSQYEENYINKNVQEVQQYIAVKPTPIKQVLHTFLATLYWNYYQNNTWKIQNRSITVDFKNDDIETWDFEKFLLACHENYQLSLKNPEILQKIDIEEYGVILDNTESFDLRPTLYDFLAHRAIDFYRSTEIDLNNAQNQFKFDKVAFLQETETFTNTKLESKKEFSYKHQMTLILQDLLNFRIKEGDKNALVDADLKRINFVYEFATFAQKDTFYLQALTKIATNGHESSARGSYEIANYYFSKKEYVKAHEICQKTIEKYPENQGAINCKSLLLQIQAKELQLHLEEYILPNSAILAKIDHRNTSKVFVKIVPTTNEEIKKIDFYNNEVSSLKNFDKSNTLAFELPVYTDFQTHNTEIKLPKQIAGMYFVLISSSEKFTKSEQFVSYSFMTVTDVSILNQGNGKEQEFFLLSRTNGLPLKNKKVEVYEEKYNRTKREYEFNKERTTQTDENGYLKLDCKENGSSIYLKVFNTDTDIYWNVNAYSLYKEREYNNYNTTQSHIFTDRKIYRPTQLVYFKGIVINYDNENYQKREIVANRSITVVLKDPNYQKVGEVTVTTNDYGTYSGTFTLPEGKLNGNFMIEDGYGNHYIKVEEYKRPTFETTIKPIEGQFRLNDKINVTGDAKAFSGAVIDQAKVSYSITRSVEFPYWRCGWWNPAPRIPATTIINAETMTDENGHFKFDFIAFPDDNTNLKDNPLFRYVISVDVTDLNGETRSTSYSVAVSNKALSLDINIPNELEKVDKKTFFISSTNLQGQSIPSKGTITIQRLKTPEKAYLNRLWGYAEKMLISQENFEQEFTYSYENVEDQTTWKVEKEILKTPFNTEKTSELEIKNFNKAGVYKVILESIDAYGEKVEQIKYVTIYDSNVKNLTVSENFFVKPLKTSVEPTENAEILIGSSHNVRVLYEIEHNKKIVHREWIELKNEQRKISIPVKEEHRGNFVTRFVCIYNNRIYSLSETIYVPFSNKELDISFETFRDKLEPGAKEQWKLKIKGKNGDKVGAEFLATLYDASLDQFAVNSWDLSIYGTYYSRFSWNHNPFSNESYARSIGKYWNKSSSTLYNRYYELDWHGYETYYYAYDDYESEGYGGAYLEESAAEEVTVASKSARPQRAMKKESAKTMAAPVMVMDMVSTVNANLETATFAWSTNEKEKTVEEKKPSEKPITPRTNFNETAFFFPHLETDSEGSIIINFTIPESLTKWKMLGLAHTKDLKTGTIENQLVTQKDLMISANAPRFFRENDQIYFTAKINNLSDKVLTGTSILELTDAISGKNIDNLLGNTQSNQSFEVKAGQSTVITWSFKISDETQAITYKVSAKAGNFTDGEQKTIPVMSNRMLVTETMPLWIRGKQQKTVEFKNFEKASSTTLKHHQFTLEFTANPTWYAVQSLPYLMEYPYECAEQTFSRLYANTISSHIIEKHPKIKEVFKKWETLTPDAFLSNLEKNEELKSVLLQETPWVLQAKDENARKRRIAVLFDLNRMANEEETAIKRLKQLQLPSGGWAWFKGMKEDRYVTQHIVTGTGKLRKLGVDNPEMVSMAKEAILYLDEQILADYQWLKKNLSASEMEKQQVGYTQIHYLYMRTFFSEVELKSKFQEAYNYYFKQSQKYWMNQSRYMKGMLAIVFERKADTKTASLITRSLKENALFSEELGMYWKDTYGYYWYQAPIETHALMIEVFDEVAKDAKSVEELKIWLLKNKQTNDWKTTKATVEACYVLLSKGDDWLASTELPTIEVGNYEIKYKGQAQKTSKKAQEVSVEAGTGYFKTTWSGKEVDKSMGTIKIDNPNASIAWGGIYWQYFEQLDKITSAETPLSLKKQLFVERKTEDKVSIEPITEKTMLKTGDRIKVRIELRVDRAMEYVHMKDMRASSFEPENVISQYKYQGGLGYYESTKDASTNFFFNYLPKGTFVFEYNLRVTHAGNFSNGITSIQCMYAPEFSSHSEGVRVEIKGK